MEDAMRPIVIILALITLSGCQALWTRSPADLRTDAYRYRSETLDIPVDTALTNYQRHAFDCGGAPLLLINPERSAAKYEHVVPGWAGAAALAVVDVTQVGPSKTQIIAYAYVGSGFDGRRNADLVVDALKGEGRCR